MSTNKLQKSIQNANNDKFSILIIGAGLAGLTLAALLRKRGYHPVVIEKAQADQFNQSGYMLGMMPIGSRPLNILEARQNYLERSLSISQYKMMDHHGLTLNTYDIEPIVDQYGDYRGISRPELVNLLLDYFPKSEINFGTTVKGIITGESPEVTFDDGTKAQFDLVIGADGLHSPTRAMILNDDEYRYYQTNWGGWVTWIDQPAHKIHEYREYWNPSSFLGFYPVKDQIGVFLGGPLKAVKAKGPAQHADEVAQGLSVKDFLTEQGLQAFRHDKDFYFWDFHDCRSHTWRKGNVLLLGDAADGFLPTAGVGASMAMDSAAVLNEELSKTDKDHLSLTLDMYERRQRPRVEKAQENSRQIGKIMFLRHRWAVSVRNLFLPFYSMDHFLKDIEKVMKAA